jgi:hypothetical protein
MPGKRSFIAYKPNSVQLKNSLQQVQAKIKEQPFEAKLVDVNNFHYDLYPASLLRGTNQKGVPRGNPPGVTWGLIPLVTGEQALSCESNSKR